MDEKALHLVKFLSTLPAMGATRLPAFFHRIADISIHAPREGSDGIAIGAAEHRVISIHAPREGSDVLSGGVNLG